MFQAKAAVRRGAPRPYIQRSANPWISLPMPPPLPSDFRNTAVLRVLAVLGCRSPAHPRPPESAALPGWFQGFRKGPKPVQNQNLDTSPLRIQFPGAIGPEPRNCESLQNPGESARHGPVHVDNPRPELVGLRDVRD